MRRSNTRVDIADLGDEFSRLRRRATRQKTSISEGSAAWQVWSSTVDEMTSLVDQLSIAEAHTLGDLAIKFDAILWAIESNDSVMDRSDLIRLRRFQRDLRRLAAG